jgi:hypothetical protein
MTNEQLIVKMTEARIILEGTQREHSRSCNVENDPESYAPCNCGASAHNNSIQKAIDKLKF